MKNSVSNAKEAEQPAAPDAASGALDHRGVRAEYRSAEDGSRHHDRPMRSPPCLGSWLEPEIQTTQKMITSSAIAAAAKEGTATNRRRDILPLTASALFRTGLLVEKNSANCLIPPSSSWSRIDHLKRTAVWLP